jgi:hypothetical protein
VTTLPPVSEMSAAEIARAFAANNREHDKFVTRDLHDQVVRELREDMREVKASVNKLIWAIMALFFTIVGQVIVSVMRAGVP